MASGQQLDAAAVELKTVSSSRDFTEPGKCNCSIVCTQFTLNSYTEDAEHVRTASLYLFRRLSKGNNSGERLNMRLVMLNLTVIKLSKYDNGFGLK